MVRFQRKQVLRNFRDATPQRRSSYESHTKSSNSVKSGTKKGSYRFKCLARIGIDLSDCLFHAGCSVVCTDNLQAVSIKLLRVIARNRSERLSGAKKKHTATSETIKAVC